MTKWQQFLLFTTQIEYILSYIQTKLVYIGIMVLYLTFKIKIMGLSTADHNLQLCHVIFFKILSLGLLRSLWTEPHCYGQLRSIYIGEVYWAISRSDSATRDCLGNLGQWSA
jgi:hypothetical protein